VAVRRLLSLVLALLVAVSSASLSSLHVHAYGEHDHPEHRHGPASHGHDHDHGSLAPAPASAVVDDHHDDHQLHGDADDHSDDGDDDAGVEAVRIEACDAGDHAISIPGVAAPLPQVHAQLAVLPGAIVVARTAPVRLALAPMDVRVHGPPPDTRLPARAPPLTLLA
jgi:hypothetical protein